MGVNDGRKSGKHTRYIDTESANVADNLGEIVHHKNYINISNIYEPSITMSFDNLELLCLDCHNKEHIATFDEAGNIKPREENILELAGVYKQ